MFRLIKTLIKGYLYLWILAGILVVIVFSLRACEISEPTNYSVLPVKDSTLTDSRDGKDYRIRRLGKLWWMIDNLNYKIEGNLYYKDAYVGLRSYCYNNKSKNCEKYGQLYDFPTAVKACPDGWRLPTEREWMQLDDAYSNCKWDPASPTANYRDSIPLYEPIAGGEASISYQEYRSTKDIFSHSLGERAVYWCAKDVYRAIAFSIDMKRCIVDAYKVGETDKMLTQQKFYSCRCVKEVK